MTRDDAFGLSDQLAEAGYSHEITVGVHDQMNPRENYRVDVRCNLTMEADRIDQLRAIAQLRGLRLAFVQPCFTFTGE